MTNAKKRIEDLGGRATVDPTSNAIIRIHLAGKKQPTRIWS